MAKGITRNLGTYPLGPLVLCILSTTQKKRRLTAPLMHRIMVQAVCLPVITGPGQTGAGGAEPGGGPVRDGGRR